MEIVEKLLIDLVQTLATRQPARDGSVDLVLRQAVERKRRSADDGERAHFGRIIAFVGAPDEIGSGSEGVGDLGGGGKKRDDARHAEIYRVSGRSSGRRSA